MKIKYLSIRSIKGNFTGLFPNKSLWFLTFVLPILSFVPSGSNADDFAELSISSDTPCPIQSFLEKVHNARGQEREQGLLQVRHLAEQKDFVKSYDDCMTTPLLLSVGFLLDAELVNVLLQAGIDPNQRHWNKFASKARPLDMFPLTYVFQQITRGGSNPNEVKKIFLLLLEAGADPTLLREGWTYRDTNCRSLYVDMLSAFSSLWKYKEAPIPPVTEKDQLQAVYWMFEQALSRHPHSIEKECGSNSYAYSILNKTPELKALFESFD